MNAPITLTLTFNTVADLETFMTSRTQRYYDFKLPDVGAIVHWKGQRFEFDGTVEQVNDNDDAGGDDKAVWVRRADTSKLVSLTFNDLVHVGNMLRAA